ncbi:MAG TPA: hypothetical protein VK585_06075 [Jiangellaceae bacterium]|nr:hypothetical protein [Jiangellaceae bacterium]
MITHPDLGHRPIESRRLRDGGALHQPVRTREAWQIDHRIDYVMARPGTPENSVAVEQAFLAGGQRYGLHPSDHYAVVADIRLAQS